MNNLLDPKRIIFKARTKKLFWLPAMLLAIALVNGIGMLQPKMYDSRSLIFIVDPPIPDYNVNQAFNLADILDTINERVNSTSFLSQVATATNLDAGLKPGSAEYNLLMIRMKKNLEFRPNRRQLNITYTGYTPQQARDVTQAMVNLLIKQFTQFYGTKTENATEFLEKRMKDYAFELAFAQKKITDYKKEFPEFLAELRPEYARQLLAREDDLNRARDEMRATSRTFTVLQAARAKMPAEIEREIPAEENRELQALEAMLKKLELEKADLLRDYTEDFRDVKEKSNQIAMVKDQISSATTTQAAKKIKEPNPRIAEIDREIAGAAQKLLQLEEKCDSLAGEILEKQKYLDNIPAVDEKLDAYEADLMRAQSQVDYYTKLLNESKRAKDATSVGMGPSLTIVDPPDVPTVPSSPNRIKIAIVSLFLGGCIGGGIILLFVMADTSLRSVEEARLILRMPVLGIVQRIQTPSQARIARRRRLLTYAGAAAFVAIVAGAGFYSYNNYREDLLIHFNQVRQMIERF